MGTASLALAFISEYHDLAKWLSHYLYFFSFSFSFSFGLTIQERVWESVTSQVSQVLWSHDRKSQDDVT